MNEQWKEEGRCNECRRQKYCGTECKAHKKRVKRELYEEVKRRLGIGRINKAAQEGSVSE